MTEAYDGRQVVGIDLHWRRSVLVRMTEDGRKLETARIDNSPGALRAVLARAGSCPRVVIEATYGWYWAADTLADAGAEVHLAHPLGVKTFAYRRVKNDERDCTDLADLLRMGRRRRRGSRRRQLRELRELTRYRIKLVRARSSAKDQVHAVLAKLGIPVPCSDLSGAYGSAWLVIGAISFVTGAIAAALAAAVGARILARTGVPIWPVPTLTLARLILGTGALLAVAAVLALAAGTAVRRSATAVAAAIVVIFVPYLLVLVPPVLPGQAGRGGFSGGGLSLVAREWLLRITPAAGFSVQQVVPQLSQAAGASYSPDWGYYPLAPWAGFAVECAWAAAALALAFYLLRRRDA